MKPGGTQIIMIQNIYVPVQSLAQTLDMSSLGQIPHYLKFGAVDEDFCQRLDQDIRET